MAMGTQAPTSGNANNCRYGIDCRRVGCYFKHPEGRLIDNAQHGGVVERRGGSTGATGYDAGKTVMAELTNGFSNLSTENEPYSPTAQELRDTWFAKAMNCDCCKGFIYGCTNDICQNLNICLCQVEQSDLDQQPDDAGIMPSQEQ